jgi:hypothetical protein
LNGKSLLTLGWDSARLAALAELLPALMADQPWSPVAGVAVPELQSTDLRLTVRLPLPSGAQEVPVVDLAANAK